MDERSQRIMNAIVNHGERVAKPGRTKAKSKRKKSKWVSEESEQCTLVTKLKRLNLLFMHAPMGGARGLIAPARMKRMGAVKGFPDLVIYDTPPNAPHKKGVVIELKRARPAPSKVSPEQKDWLEKLNLAGYECRVCYGAEEAMQFINELGWT